MHSRVRLDRQRARLFDTRVLWPQKDISARAHDFLFVYVKTEKATPPTITKIDSFCAGIQSKTEKKELFENLRSRVYRKWEPKSRRARPPNSNITTIKSFIWDVEQILCSLFRSKVPQFKQKFEYGTQKSSQKTFCSAQRLRRSQTI